jgi:hypothetical protein
MGGHGSTRPHAADPAEIGRRRRFYELHRFCPGRDVGIFVGVNRVDFTMFFGLAKAANELLASLAPR